jgi:D-3-phosphoglycerate dehydrogenase / 2-oxoglutarate reductase
MIRKKILVSAPLDFLPDLKERIFSEHDCIYLYKAEKEKIAEYLKENAFDAWMCSPCPTYMINSELIDLCPTLKMIATPSTGVSHLVPSDAEARNIFIYRLKGTAIVDKIYASSEFTFNLLISTIRNTPHAFEAVKKGKWREVEKLYRGRELNGLTLGIIGYGRIGSNLARYSLAFGMKILAYDPYVKIDHPEVTQVSSLDDLLSVSDVVSPCVHLNQETYHMVNKTMFDKMKDGVFFINTSRGDVVKEADLLYALKSGKILAAGVDVISDEYLGDKQTHPLISYAQKNNNLIITPHIAGLTYDSERKAQTAAYEAICEYLKFPGGKS